MFEDFRIPTRPMTRDDVLAVLFELARNDLLERSSLDRLSFTSNVLDWERCFPDGFDRRSAGAQLNELFRTAIAEEEWHRTLSAKATLGDLCDLVAAHAVMPVIEPISVMGDRSRAAGAFLVVRRMLQDEGVDVSDLRPSSPTGPYLKEKFAVMMPRLRCLAPGLLPSPTVVAPAHDACALAGAACYVGMLLGLTKLLPPTATFFYGLAFAGFLLATCVLNRSVKPLDVRIGATRNFRELCQVLAGERIAWPGFPIAEARGR